MSESEYPKFGNWQAMKVLGRGGQAIVYKASDTQAYRENRVIKWFVGDFPIERFDRELTALKKFRNTDGLPTILDSGSHQGHPWISMKFEEGVELHEFVTETGPTTATDWLVIALTLTSALESVHRVNVTHRDIKPQNILINISRKATLIDFGLAVIDNQHSQTGVGDVFGTLKFAAPEWDMGTVEWTPKFDIYSLAATLTFLAYGGFPPQVLGKSIPSNEDWGDAARNLPDLWQSEILSACFALEPKQRPTAAELLGALKNVTPDVFQREGIVDGQTAEQIWQVMHRLANTKKDSRNLLPWLEIVYSQGHFTGSTHFWYARELAQTYESLEDFEGSAPYWETCIEQEPVGGNISLFRALRKRVEQTPAVMDRATDCLHRAGQAGGFEDKNTDLGYSFIEIGDYESALRCFEPSDANYPLRALCHHRLNLEHLENEPTTPHYIRAWMAAARRLESSGCTDDAAWLRSQAGPNWR